MSARTTVQAFFDDRTGTVPYLLVHKAAASVGPVLDFDFKSGHTATMQADKVLACIQDQGLTVSWILETHAHADHLSGARYLQEKVGGRIAIGERITEVQATFKKLYNLERNFLPDGGQFDHLFKDNEAFKIGETEARALLVPGHTPADMAYLGDGADFPGGDARTLYRSMRRILALPPETTMFVCHDYPPEGRAAAWETTVAAQRARNIHVRDSVSEDEFAAMRNARDATLEVPTLIL